MLANDGVTRELTRELLALRSGGRRRKTLDNNMVNRWDNSSPPDVEELLAAARRVGIGGGDATMVPYMVLTI